MHTYMHARIHPRMCTRLPCIQPGETNPSTPRARQLKPGRRARPALAVHKAETYPRIPQARPVHAPGYTPGPAHGPARARPGTPGAGPRAPVGSMTTKGHPREGEGARGRWGRERCWLHAARARRGCPYPALAACQRLSRPPPRPPTWSRHRYADAPIQRT